MIYSNILRIRILAFGLNCRTAFMHASSRAPRGTCQPHLPHAPFPEHRQFRLPPPVPFPLLARCERAAANRAPRRVIPALGRGEPATSSRVYVHRPCPPPPPSSLSSEPDHLRRVLPAHLQDWTRPGQDPHATRFCDLNGRPAWRREAARRIRLGGARGAGRLRPRQPVSLSRRASYRRFLALRSQQSLKSLRMVMALRAQATILRRGKLLVLSRPR